MGNYLLRDAITQQVIQTGEDVVLFNINNPLSRANELLPRCEFSGSSYYYDNFSETDGFALVRTGKLADCAEVELDEHQLFLNNQESQESSDSQKTKLVKIMTTLSHDLNSEEHKRIDIVISKFVMDKLVERYNFNNSDEFRFICFFFTDVVAEMFKQSNDGKFKIYNLQYSKQEIENSLHSLFLLTYAYHNQKQSDYDELIKIKDKIVETKDDDEQVKLLNVATKLYEKILDNKFILKRFFSFIANINDKIVNLFKFKDKHNSQESSGPYDICEFSENNEFFAVELVVQLFQYYIAFIYYKLDNHVIFLPNQYTPEENIAYENLSGNDFAYLVNAHNSYIKNKYEELDDDNE